MWVDESPKRRHGRRERRELWALADPALNRYAGSAGTVGGGVAPPGTGMPDRAAADGERTDTDNGELCGDQCGPCCWRGKAVVAGSQEALGHREPGALGKGRDL